MKTYSAPWSTLLIVISALITVICISVTLLPLVLGGTPSWWFASGFLLIVLCAPFTIRAYTITSDAILIHRLFWKTRLPLTGLKSAQFQFEAMNRSIRLCGNGGVFSFTGWFRNKLLGNYRAFVTDHHNTIVLRFATRTIVISPASPEDFVQHLSHQVKLEPDAPVNSGSV